MNLNFVALDNHISLNCFRIEQITFQFMLCLKETYVPDFNKIDWEMLVNKLLFEHIILATVLNKSQKLIQSNGQDCYYTVLGLVSVVRAVAITFPFGIL